MSTLDTRPHWSAPLFQDNDPAGHLVVIGRHMEGGPCIVTLCTGETGFLIAEDVPFEQAMEIAIEAIRRGARLCIDIVEG